ncbi:hypothetical protein TNCV_4056481 [Trichonephila clavipes]|nr:hypothetical protein TNCV_4056481 [Trichonephila clavipes]
MISHHSCTRFVVDHNIEDAPVWDAESRVAPAMVSELRVHDAVNNVELTMQTVVVLQTTPIPDSRTATAGSDVVQSGRPIFDEFFQHLWPYINNNTAYVVFQMIKHRPMTLHSPTENSLAVLNHKILEANSQVQNVKLGGH